MKLNSIERLALKKATGDLLKISFFIGFIPSFIALMVDFIHLDFELNKLTQNTSLPEVSEMMNALIPNNQLYIDILGTYVCFYIILLFIVFIKTHYGYPINQKILNFCKFFSPIAEVLFQLIAILSGFFITLFILSIFIDGFMTSLKYLLPAFLMLAIAIPIIMINIIVTQNYMKN
ncbi:hypothetical protein RJ729_18355 [Acinetobacter pittii]|uniref:hypothetical protein n=1 Tax=Acinetobacter pittii TaxID=48296 RepID=UPI00389153FD